MRKIFDFSNLLLKNYKSFNIEDIEVMISENTSVSVKSRHQKLENIERSKNSSIGINIFKDKRKATLTSNNIDNADAKEFLEKGSAMVKSMPIDEFSGLAEKKDYATNVEDLDLEDTLYLDDKKLLNHAIMAEEAMLDIKGVTNSEGSTRSFSKNTYSIFNSRDFHSSYNKTYHSISSIAIAGSDTNMQRDYEYSAAIHSDDLVSAAKIGSLAAKRATSRLNSKKIKSCSIDVIFEPRVARSILSSFCSCASGSSIARGTSFLSNKLYSLIFIIVAMFVIDFNKTIIFLIFFATSYYLVYLGLGKNLKELGENASITNLEIVKNTKDIFNNLCPSHFYSFFISYFF